MKLRKAMNRYTVLLGLGLAVVIGLKLGLPRPPLWPEPRTTQIAAVVRSVPNPTTPSAAQPQAKQATVRPVPEETTAATRNPVLEEGLVAFQPALKERLFATSDNERKTLRVQLLGGESVPLEVTRHEVLDEHSGVIHGAATDEPGSEVLLAYVNEAVAGTMFFPKRGLFQIRHVGDGQHRVVKLDPTWMPPCGVGDLPPDSEPGVDTLPLGTAILDKNKEEGGTPANRVRRSGDSNRPTVASRAADESVASSGYPVTLSWSPSPDATVIGYNLYYGDMAGTQTNKWDVGPALTATLPNLQAGVTYFFFATAYDAAGVESEPSNFITHTPDSGATTVDILVAYTTTTKNANGGESGISALINSSIATANTAFNNSRAGVTLRLAGKVEVAYADSGALTTDLPRLQNTTDGHMDNLPVLRSSYRADLVCLLVHSGGSYAGLAYLWTAGASSSAFSPWGYSVVVDAYADAFLTLAHEVGHNFGCGHAPGDGGSGAYSYSTGRRFTADNVQYRTVMAYAPGTRISYFSNPGVSFLGVATGTSTANNAQTLINSKATIASIQSGSTLYQEWTPVAATDLNADTKPDLLWRSSTSGRVVNWFMDDTNTTSIAALWNGDSAWQPVASADFNADFKPDILWRNSTSGRVIVWFMDGTNTLSTAVIWSGEAAWVPRAAGDFNADGKPDILWRNAATGRVIIWFLNGVVTASTTAIWSGDPSWVPVATGDFNADSKPDILWRNSTSGRVVVWFMNGGTNIGTAVLWSGDASWAPLATGDFNADGQSDIIWRNSSSGRVIIWYMNGTTQIGIAGIWG